MREVEGRRGRKRRRGKKERKEKAWNQKRMKEKKREEERIRREMNPSHISIISCHLKKGCWRRFPARFGKLTERER